MTNTIIGVDEAGRGCVVGPLVIAACRATPEQQVALKRANIRDSKKYDSHENRLVAVNKILDTGVRIYRQSFSASTVDIYVKKNGLNDLERAGGELAVRTLLGAEYEDDIIFDSEQMFRKTAKEFNDWDMYHGHAIAEDKADKNHVAVAAASVIAKTERDIAAIEIMGEKAWSKGAGYPNEFTEAWLRKRLRELGRKAGFVDIRQSWKWLANRGIR